MERLDTEKEIGPLSASDFTHCVDHVIRDYGRDELGDITIREMVQEITQLATDRLCLLAGTGDDQTDVDFVIQPFREYFAAAYLAKHEEASTDAVYSSLSSRSNVWLNVLQFYCAFKSGSEQRAWALEADEAAGDGVSMLARQAHARHILFSVMPEFQRAKNRLVRRVLAIVFHKETRWMWFGRPLALRNTLETYVGGPAFRHLLGIFSPLSLGEPQLLEAELYLLCATATETDGPDLVAQLNQLIAHGGHVEAIAIQSASAFDLPVNLSTVPPSRFVEVISSGSQFLVLPDSVREDDRSSFEDALPDPLRLASQFHRPSRYQPPGWLAELARFLSSENVVSDDGQIRYVVKPMFRERSRLSQDSMSRLVAIQSPLASYLAALIVLIQEGTEEAHKELLAARQSLEPDRPLDYLLAEHQVRSVGSADCDAVRSFLQQVSFSDGSWVALFVDEGVWRKAFNGSEERLSILNGLWEQISDPSLIADSLLYISASSTFTESSSELLRVFLLVLDAVGERGSNAVRDLPGGFPDRVALVNETVTDPTVTQRVINHPSLLSLPRGWTDFALILLSSCDAVSTETMLGLWKRRPLKRLPRVVFTKPSEARVNELLSLETRDAITLAAHWISGYLPRETPFDRQLDVKVVTALCALIKEAPDEELRALTWLLRRQRPCSPEELRVWADPRVMTEVRPLLWWHDDVADRISEFGRLSTESEVERAKLLLGEIVRDRNRLPRCIVSASLKALWRLEEVATQPLKEADWHDDELETGW